MDLSKGIVMCPLSFYFIFLFFLFFNFWWPHWLFLFISHLSSWDLLICPLLGSFILSYLRSFPHFRGNTLYITRSIEDLSDFTKVLNIKNMKLSWCMQMYASVSVEGYAMILACHVAIIRARPNYHAAHPSRKRTYDMKTKSWEDGCCMGMYLGKAMEMPCR